ncbi:unnamed protein product, partial [Polarella glacialis]
VPLPSYKHTPLERLMSDKLGIRLRVEDVALAQQLIGSTEYVLPELRERYFGWQQAGKHLQLAVKPDASENGTPGSVYLQLGWLDGVAVYKGSSVQAELTAWETEDQILAFDHLPLRATVKMYW